ncbi:MAG: metal-dependent hydrolase [Calditerricola sp.]|nr:metal-dependent hydrolase [Calditerricola sp.]
MHETSPLGHAMFLFTSAADRRYLIDPFFDLNPGCPEAYQTPEFLRTIRAVLLTHGHFDHTSGLKRVVNANPDVTVVAQYELALLLLQRGLAKNVIPINYGGTVSFDDLRATMVPAIHTSSFGETEGTPVYAGAPCGYVLEFAQGPTVYFSGDTTVTKEMELIRDLYRPDIAVLSCSGHFTMGPREAAYAARELLRVKTVIPSHSFPTRDQAPRPETLDALLQAFPVVKAMISKEEEPAPAPSRKRHRGSDAGLW